MSLTLFVNRVRFLGLKIFIQPLYTGFFPNEGAPPSLNAPALTLRMSLPNLFFLPKFLNLSLLLGLNLNLPKLLGIVFLPSASLSFFFLPVKLLFVGRLSSRRIFFYSSDNQFDLTLIPSLLMDIETRNDLLLNQFFYF